MDPLTEGRHSLLRQTASYLSQNAGVTTVDSHLQHQVDLSLNAYPAAAQTLAAFQELCRSQIDMAALIRSPEELFVSEAEWAGADYKKAQESKRALQGSEHGESRGGQASEDPASLGVDESMAPEDPNTMSIAHEGPDLFAHVLSYSADTILALERERIERSGKAGSDSTLADVVMSSVHEDPDGLPLKRDDTDDTLPSPATASLSSQPGSNTRQPDATALPDAQAHGETPLLRNLRLNLLALAKRAPLDTIARLPADLVPEHIRHYVPALVFEPGSGAS